MVSAKTGIISTIAAGVSGGITYDGAGNLYVGTATFGNSIEKINLSTLAMVTIAGTGTAGYSGDGGPAASATFGVRPELPWTVQGTSTLPIPATVSSA